MHSSDQWVMPWLSTSLECGRGHEGPAECRAAAEQVSKKKTNRFEAKQQNPYTKMILSGSLKRGAGIELKTCVRGCSRSKDAGYCAGNLKILTSLVSALCRDLGGYLRASKYIAIGTHSQQDIGAQ